MNTITYRLPQIGDEHQISGCMWASAVLWELIDGTPESVAEWKKLCSPEQLRDRILSGEKTIVATWNEIVVGFIAFRRGKLLDSKEYIDCPPEFVTDAEHLEVLNELIQREPIFHHPEFGTTRENFENMTDAAFWEVGASGRRYNREYTLTEVVQRYENPQYRGIHSPPENTWKTKDFYCHEIADNTYLLTYTLVQEERVTR